MRFDQLPTELLVNIARKSDISTRCYVSRASKRMFNVYKQFPHSNSVERVVLKLIEQDGNTRIAVTIVDAADAKLNTAEITLYQSLFMKTSPLFVIGKVDEIVLRNLDCSGCTIASVLRFLPVLRKVKQFSFDNCFFRSTEDFLSKVVNMYSVNKVKVICPTAFNINIINILSNTFFCTFTGDFQLIVHQKKDISKYQANIAINSLNEFRWLLENQPILESVRCQFTPICLAKYIQAIIWSNSGADVNPEMLPVPQEIVNDLNNMMEQVIAEAILTLKEQLSGLRKNMYYIAEENKFMKYSFKKKDCTIKFKVQHHIISHDLYKKHLYP